MSVHTPAPSAIAPASHGNTAPPRTDTPFMSPMAVGTSRASVRFGTTAIAVGNTGPRKNPSSASPAPATSPAGAAQISPTDATIAPRHTYAIVTVLQPSRAATGLIRNRPAVRPSQ